MRGVILLLVVLLAIMVIGVIGKSREEMLVGGKESASRRTFGVMKVSAEMRKELDKVRISMKGVKQQIDPSLPTTFDGRVQWPDCIHPVRDQGDCGSCWAFAATETLSDRFCIFSGKKTDVVLSPENLLSCEEENLGCSMGSLPQWAWGYLQTYGVVAEQCIPYTSGSGVVESCSTQCTTGENYTLYYASNYTHVGSFIDPSYHVEEIMRAVMEGPVDVTFDVWGDFMDYNGGVYRHLSGTYEGLHSVKVIGWGTENGVDYWLVQNSWGTEWGPYGGFFKIRKGQDECFIESLVYTGYPKI